MLDNLDRYRDSQVVTKYTETTGLDYCEGAVVEQHIPFGSDILDLGVGAGRTTPSLAARAKSYLGVDYSEHMVEAARMKFPQYKFAVMDATNMASLASASFDVIVFSFNGLGCIPTSRMRMQCIRECHRLLRKRGIFIFSLHNSDALFCRPVRATRSFSDTVRGVLSAIRKNANQGILTRARWVGHGYIKVAADGGLRLFAASRQFVKQELKAAGFSFVSEYALCDYYTMHNSPWIYYVFKS